jgi:alcohol dehydrogenase class IV
MLSWYLYSGAFLMYFKGAVHGFAGPIGGMFERAPHGAVCAALLADTIDVNVKALKERDPNSSYLKKYCVTINYANVQDSMK